MAPRALWRANRVLTECGSLPASDFLVSHFLRKAFDSCNHPRYSKSTVAAAILDYYKPVLGTSSCQMNAIPMATRVCIIDGALRNLLSALLHLELPYLYHYE